MSRRLSDVELREKIAAFELINRDRTLTNDEADQLWRLVHIETCRIKARRRSIERNQARLSALTEGMAA
ncbi:hypothetical protein [uncultured Sphingopyxis sp.]|jgi:hypothetical protein|uniref:hypothetical protein n=1 Tax=uncultured Sphingopyxis sp. TaxID=310581 RepID=UPI000B1E3E80|nr:hypothetical protein [uncultured Sphingopyxis sp.]